MKKDDPFARRLAGLIVPAPDPAARGRALERATIALQSAPTSSAATQTWIASHRLAFLGGTAAILGLLVAGAFLFSRQQAASRPSLATERTVLFQMETLFGSRLDAVIESADRTPDIHLSADLNVAFQPSLTQPVFIQFQRAGQRATRVLSYSGRKICVMLRGHLTCFEPLVTGRGGVILNGERSYWTSNQPSHEFDGYRVTACSLPRS